MKRDYRIYLRDIVEAFGNARQCVEGLSYEEFIADKKTTSAVVRELEVAGEATKQLPAAVRKKYPDIPWSDIAGMRDKLYCSRLNFRVLARASSFTITVYDLTRGNLLP